MTSSAANPSSQNPQQQTLDPYRPIASQVKHHLLPFLPSTSQIPDLPSLLSLDAQTYSSRLSGKNVILAPGSSSGPSSLVRGRKRHRGDDSARANARRDAEERQRDREELGLVGMRKAKSRLPGRGCVGRGMKIPYASFFPKMCMSSEPRLISYDSLLPLHYLHTHYLLQLLSLPPLPSSLPSAFPHLPLGISPESIQAKLVKADFTGILLHVTSSRNPSLTGIKGIVIEETASTFRLVTSTDKAKVIPKDGTLFSLSFPAYAIPPPVASDDGEVPEPMDFAGHIRGTPHIQVDLLGSAFGFRSGDRAGRKFRPAQGGGGGSGWGEVWVEGEWFGVLREVDKGVLKGKSAPAPKKRRKRGKSRRKDPPVGGTLQVF